MAEINSFLSPEAQKQVSQYKNDLQQITTQYTSLAKSLQTASNKTKNVAKNEQTLTALQKERAATAKKTKQVFAQSLALQEKGTKSLILGQERLKIARKNARLEAQKQLGVVKKTGGLFKTMGKSIVAATAGMMGFMMVLRGLKNAGKLVRDFQKENAVLAGVLNKTREEISGLTDDAQRLGSTTAKTAKEITGLQIAYARLGFTQAEILNLTGDTINGSIALNAELDQTAELTGAVVRSFDEFSSTDASEILDIMTMSTQKTALNFGKLQAAIPVVAGAASAAKVPFTTMIAQLGQAADRGIDASTAATSLRNIYLELAKKGLTLDQALKKINTSQDKLSTANQLFGKRAAVTALALANTTDKTKELDIELNKAGGTAKKVAEEQLATLDGSILLLTSAWEGFILSIEDGDGAIGRLVGGSLKKLADMLTVLSNLDLVFTRDSKLTIEQISRTYDVLNAINNKTGRKFREFVDEYEDSNSRWLQDNKATVIQFLDDLGFSNKEAEALYKEHLARRITSELNAIDASLNATKKANKEIVEGDEETINKRIENLDKIENEHIKKESAITDFIKQQVKERLGEEGNYTVELSDELNERYIKNKEFLDKKEADEEAAATAIADLRTSLATQEVDLFTSSTNTLFDLAQSRRDAELTSIQASYAAKIEAAEGNDALQLQLTEELAAKDLEIRQQQAQSEINQALLNLGITTAQKGFEIQATVATLAAAAALNPLLLPAVALAQAQLPILLASSGLAAVAIASSPIPEFFRGTTDTPYTFSAGERGSELMIKKDGSIELTPDQKTVYSGKEYQHAQIIPNEPTKSILRKSKSNDNKELVKRIDKLISVTERNNTNIHFSRNVGRLNKTYFKARYKKDLN